MVQNLVPRLFQDEIARQAIEGNVLVRADTGIGKTYIAILLMRRLAALPPTSSEHKLVIFLTPTVALVEQQAQAIAEQTTLRVKRFIGADGVDYWRREHWIKQLDAADVCVMSPQIWLNVLANAYWSLDKVSLLVFDEAHHASKRHPYAEIMRNHYHPLKARRPAVALPRILGLTASPIFNVKNPAMALRDLEATLDVRVVEITKVSPPKDVETFAPKAVEQLIEHPRSPLRTTLSDGDLARYNHLSAHVELDGRTRDRVLAAEQLFGRAGVEVFWALAAKEHSAPPDLVAQLEAAASTPVALTDLSPKALALVTCLEGFRDQPHFHAIVFVQQRHQAKILAALIRRVAALGWVKPGFLTGHGGRGRPEEEGKVSVSKEVGMAIKELNLLVATRVAEEGLDFQKPACNLVVRFDTLDTITGYIQSRGRARSAHALYVVIAEAKSLEAERYKTYVLQEQSLKQLYADRPPETPELKEPELAGLPTFTTTAGALLTFQSAIPLLANFCSLLNRTDPYTPLQKPVYRVSGADSQWSAQLTLPKIAALKQHVFVSKAWLTKKAARQQTAFDVCRLLHQAGALDNHLLPIRETHTVGAVDALGRVVDCTPLPKVVDVSTLNVYGDIWNSTSAWLHVVEVAAEGKTYRLGLLCGAQLSSFDDGELFDQAGGAIQVRLLRAKATSWADPGERLERIRRLEDFNRDCVRIALNRRIGDETFFALWTLLDGKDEIDWAAIESAFRPCEVDKLTPSSLIVVPSRRPTARIGRLLRVRPDVTSSSPTAEVEENPPRHKRNAIARYPDYFVYLKVAYDFHDLAPDAAEPIIEFEPLRLPSGRLARPVEEPPSTPPRVRAFPTSMCRLTTLSPDFWSTFAMVPALNRLISSRSMVMHASERFKLPPIASKHLVEGLTAPMSNCGIDYQLLETVGDSALKLATTVHVYLEYPTAEEGRLTTLRGNSVDNRFLRRRSLESGYSAFVLSAPFRPTTFVPETSDDAILSSDSLFVTRKVGRRVLSDTIEATLGAAVATAGFDMALEAGECLGLCFGGTTPWHERPSGRALLEVERAPAAPGMRLLEETLAYKFGSHGHLLVQALTHRSYPGGGYCYEREEYLGDAILDYWSTVRLFTLYPHATPRSLTFKRALLVSNGVLALLAVRKLNLHKMILHASPALERAMIEAAEQAEAFGWEAVVEGDLTFLWSPPKVLGDVLEALLAVVFIDAGFKLDPVLAVLDELYKEVMPFLSETEHRDPYSRFLMWSDARQCTELSIKVTQLPSSPASPASLFSAVCTFHGQILTEQLSSSRAVARQLAAKHANEWLNGPMKGEDVEATCRCREEARRKREEGDVETAEAEAEADEVSEETSDQGTNGPLSLVEADGAQLEDEEEEDEKEEEGGGGGAGGADDQLEQPSTSLPPRFLIGLSRTARLEIAYSSVWLTAPLPRVRVY
ncbi:hypothetical protein JCM5296_003512 [Sporobolomyces johnsonii]